MTDIQAERHCDASAREVWKLLYDPVRFARWWPGWERVEVGDGPVLTRFDDRWPDFAYPATVTTDTATGRVVVSCLLSDIVHTWTIENCQDGCQISVQVSVPESAADHAEDTAEIVRRALTALVAEAESG